MKGCLYWFTPDQRLVKGILVALYKLRQGEPVVGRSDLLEHVGGAERADATADIYRQAEAVRGKEGAAIGIAYAGRFGHSQLRRRNREL